jgi:hypothetical protein
MKDWKTLHDMINSTEYQGYISDRLGNDLFINDPDRASRCHDAAEDGADGSTHREVIQDEREFLDGLKIYDPDFDEDDSQADLTQAQYDALSAELDAVEQWHENNKSLDTEIG